MEYDRIYSIRKGEYFADALKRAGKDFIPTNCIINKLLPRTGRYTLRIDSTPKVYYYRAQCACH